MVSAAMSEFQFVRFRAVSERGDLQPEAYSEDRVFPKQRANRRYSFRNVFRVSRPVRDKNAVRFELFDILRRRVPRGYRNGTSASVERPNDIRFHTAVDRHDVKPVVFRERRDDALAAHPRNGVGRDRGLAKRLNRFVFWRRRGGDKRVSASEIANRAAELAREAWSLGP